MSEKLYKVKDVARLARVTVRTLHHYDAIGLLEPSGRTRAGYRQYSEDDLLRLQEIVICREFGMSLEQIRRTLEDPGFDRERALHEHRKQLVERSRRTEAMIRSVDAALEALKGDDEMQASDLFQGFDPAQYAKEARQRWGKTDAYKESAKRTRGYSKQDWAQIQSENEDVLNRLAETMQRGVKAQDAAAMDLAEEHRLHIDRWFYPCDHSMHLALAGLYTADQRFAASFEKHGEGLAAFLVQAVQANAGRSGAAS